jgi:hypothetical protein
MVNLYVHRYISTKNQAFWRKKGANGHFSVKKMMRCRSLTKLQPQSDGLLSEEHVCTHTCLFALILSLCNGMGRELLAFLYNPPV